ncbi:MAG: polysaccharide biosynthesis/export family protein [Deltaproteobacteria bacterium]|nr:polysaccharide biosynthesis/export family protein [Deltaproteobacteria bacterium]
MTFRLPLRPWILTLFVAPSAVACSHVCLEVPQSERGEFLAARPEEGGYVIGVGDEFQVEVWENAQLTRTVRVRPDGKVTFPLVSEIDAAGLTVPALQERMTKALKSFLKDPVVSITVTGFSTKQIFIQGAVGNPAAYNYTGDMYLLQALTLAGGPTPFADGCAVVVRRKGEAFLRYSLALEPLLSSQNLSENIRLQPGDVVTVR